MKKILILATNNEHKLIEVRQILPSNFEVLSLKEYVDEFKKMQKEFEHQLQGDPVRVSVPVKQVAKQTT